AQWGSIVTEKREDRCQKERSFAQGRPNDRFGFKGVDADTSVLCEREKAEVAPTASFVPTQPPRSNQ
ncbi:MAG: hypothetical protein ACI36X_08390, partial [Bacteroidaceae bacterium]